MNTLMGARLSDAKWRNATPAEVANAVGVPARYRGDERHNSVRGFGPRRKRNEILPGQTSVRDGWYYDTLTTAAGAAFAKTPYFSTAIGVSGKNLSATNLTGQGGQVPAGETLVVRSVRIYIANTTVPADFQNIINNVSVQFLVRNFPIYQCTPEWFPAGNGGVTLAVGNLGTLPSGTASVASSTNGMPVQTSVYDLKAPYTMESQLNFTVLLTPETAFNLTASSGTNPLGVGTTIRIWLEGEKQQVIAN
jgi:hypothetical protein